jgi:hypothetical protein
MGRIDPSIPTRSSRRRRPCTGEIVERFPDSGVGRVVDTLTDHARRAGELSRWLERPNLWFRSGDYYSESLSITSKIAAIHVQNFDDPVTLAAVNEIASSASRPTTCRWAASAAARS